MSPPGVGARLSATVMLRIAASRCKRQEKHRRVGYLPSSARRGPLETMDRPSIVDTRAAQMFPILTPAEIERVSRFGTPRRFESGEAVVQVGDMGHGMTLILSGDVRVTRRDDDGQSQLIATHHPGGFMGELAQLSGRPSLVDAHAVGPVEALLGCEPCWWPRRSLASGSCGR